MNIPDNLLDEMWGWAAWAVWLPFFLRSVFRAPWGRLKNTELLNVWLGLVVFLTLVWSLKAGVKPGLSFHLLGATLFSLCFGGHMAFIGLSLVQLGITLNGAASPFFFALNALLVAGCAVCLTQYLEEQVVRLLPRHFFVFIFANGFFVAALSVIGVGLMATLFFGIAGAYSFDYLFSEYFPYFTLLAFSEAWLSGMMLTLFVVYCPEWVVTFDDSRYLRGK